MPSAVIIDDNEADRYLLRRLLKQGKLVTETFEFVGGADALAFLGDYDNHRIKHPDGFPPTWIFVDINMPGMTGFEFLREFNTLANRHDFSQVHVFVISSSDDPNDRKTAQKYTFVNGYIVKMPTGPAELKAALAPLPLPSPA